MDARVLDGGIHEQSGPDENPDQGDIGPVPGQQDVQTHQARGQECAEIPNRDQPECGAAVTQRRPRR